MKTTKTKYELFAELYRKNIHSGVQRKGQATFNSVCEIDEEIANKLRGTDKDCFYNDSKVSDFMKEVWDKWEKE